MLLAFGFGNLAMLGWLAAAAAPILIHLWSRRRYREVPWAAVEFLLAAMRKNARRIQLQQWILLAVRTLLILLVVFAVAEPYWESLPGGGGLGGPVHRVLVLDGSFSMGYRPEGETLFAQTQQLAGQLVEASRVGDAFTVILMGQPSRSLLGRPVLDKATVREEISGLRLPHGGGDLASALRLVEESIELAERDQSQLAGHEVYFFTDLGQTSWRAAVRARGEKREERGDIDSASWERLLEKAAVVVVDVGQPRAENLAVTRLESAAAFATLGSEVAFRGTVSNFSDQGREQVEVELVVDGAVAESQTVDLAGFGESAVSFSHRFDSPGDKTVALRIGGDRLAIDNSRWLVVPVKEELRVLCVAGKLGAADYLARALDPESPDAPRQSTIQPLLVADGELLDLDLARFDCVFLSNVARLTRDEAAVLARYVRQGGGLVVFLGDRVVADEYNRVLATADGESEPLLAARLGEVVGGAGFRIDPLEYRHAIVAPFRGRERAGLLTTPVYRYFRLEVPENRPATEVALALAGGDPLIVTSPLGEGRTVLVATAGSLESVDPATGQPWTTMPAWPSFLPIVREMLVYALGGGQRDDGVLVGQPLAGTVSGSGSGESVEIARPDGRVDTVPVTDSLDGPAWSYDETDVSGVYAVRAGDPAKMAGLYDGPAKMAGLSTESLAVNVDSVESDLARIDPAELPEEVIVRSDWRGGSGAASDAGLTRRGPMHRSMLYGALGLALAEIFLAWLFGRGTV